MTYSILDQASNKVIDMEICQCTQAGNSNRMEKFAFVKVLNRLKNENIKIEMLTTDRHSQIRMHMREEEKKCQSSVRCLAFLQEHKAKVEQFLKKQVVMIFAHG